ncbi:MAG: immunity 17 family protein [Deltaproteobacteria bacterium]|nr:immunity 17 family protein [Deltaproteobacteria bacterium]
MTNSRSSHRRSPQLDAALVVLAIAAALAGYTYVPADPDHAGVGMLLIAAGLFSAIASLANIPWFFRARRARLMTMLLGRTGARMLYVLIGGGLVGAGVQLLLAT